MSWTLANPEIRNLPASEAIDALNKNTAPESIKNYVAAGIAGLADRYGPDVRVTVIGYGHLCDGPTSYDVTSATIGVRKAEAVPDDAGPKAEAAQGPIGD